MKIYLPALALKKEDLIRRAELLERYVPDAEHGFELVLPSTKCLEGKYADAQVKNLRDVLREYDIEHVDIHGPIQSTRPDEKTRLGYNLDAMWETNFLSKPKNAESVVKKTVEFAAHLPEQIETRKVNMHFNTLAYAWEWDLTPRIHSCADEQSKWDYWKNVYEISVRPYVSRVISFGKENGIDVCVETMPEPEFGDTSDENVNSLWDPFPILPNREIPDILWMGGNITHDISHEYITAEAVGFCRELERQGVENPTQYFKGLFPEDLEQLPEDFDIFTYLSALQPNDHVHFSEAVGKTIAPKLARQLGREPSYFMEGVELGIGEIGKDAMRKVLRLAKEKDVGVNVEISDIDPSKPIQTENSLKMLAEMLKY